MALKFWFVWNPAGNQPRHKHDSKTSAKNEAKRLAEAFPGQEFYVLESLGHYKVRDPIQWHGHEAMLDTDQVPF